MDRQLAMI